MKNFNLLKLSFAAALLSLAPVSQVYAQPHIAAFDGNPYADFVGERVMITSPTTIARSLGYTITDDGSDPATNWGGPIIAPINSSIVKADPYLACGPLTNAGAIAGKVALIERGDCEFGAKALAAKNAGAVAVIIVNNVDGGPVGMGAGAVGAQVTDIPVLMISKDDGAAIVNALNSGAVNITLSKWGNNTNRDLGIVKSGVSMWHNYAIPGSQMTNASSHTPYKGINAAVVANFGNTTETNVRLATKVTFHPDGGGSPSVIRQDTSDALPSFPTSDSIRTLMNKNTYDLNNSKQEGRYEVNYEILKDGPDDFVFDNSYTHNFYVSRNVFSKGRYDFSKNMPMSNIGYSYSSTQVNNYVMGPLYYVANGGYQINALQASVSLGGTSNDLDGTLGNLLCLVWKWVDGSNGQPKDSVIQMGEAVMVGEASYKFDDDDTSGQFFTIPVKNILDQTKPLVTEGSTWYWVTAAMPKAAYLAMDGQLNYLVRSFARSHAAAPYKEYYGPATPTDYDALQQTATNEPGMFPFEGNNFIDSARFSQQRKGTLPAIPMIISQFPVSVNETIASASNLNVAVFPNPAKESITISTNLKPTNDAITIRVVDGLGRVVKFENRKYDGNSKFTLAVNDLAAGNYHLIFSAGNDTRVVNFTTVK
ncbi:MAG: T9SS type A sorting domain-containing protein [Sphingobacteriales bacterium]|nr:MAG: T9SS type A sorting domain-containing protein [Sphingobacteriales bacterium]